MLSWRPPELAALQEGENGVEESALSRVASDRRRTPSPHHHFGHGLDTGAAGQGEIRRHGQERTTRVCAVQKQFRGTGRDLRNRARAGPKPSASASSATLA